MFLATEDRKQLWKYHQRDQGDAQPFEQIKGDRMPKNHIQLGVNKWNKFCKGCNQRIQWQKGFKYGSRMK